MKMRYRHIKKASSILLLGLAMAACTARGDEKWDISKLDAGKLPAAADKKGVTYDKDICPLLETACFGCHGERKQMGRLRLDTLEGLLKGGEDGKVVVPGDSKKSPLLFAVAQVEDSIAMPPKRKGGGPGGPGGGPKAFTTDQVGLIRAWIDQKAK